MFKVNDIVRFYFLLIVVLITLAVLNKLPETFALVLVYD